jgi:hypothetical protein
MLRLLAFAALVSSCQAADWPQFRGPNGSGVGEAKQLPTHFGPGQNVVWKTAVPAGLSSPVVFGDRIFITGAENSAPDKKGVDKLVDRQTRLYTLAIDRLTGKVVWKREAPRNRAAQYQTNNSPATPARQWIARACTSSFRISGCSLSPAMEASAGSCRSALSTISTDWAHRPSSSAIW